MDANIESAMMAIQARPVTPPQMGKMAAGKTTAATDKAAKEFESVFISQFLGSMFSGIKTDGLTGGGQGEEMFRSLMIDQYSKSVEAQGGFGLAASVKRQMLKMQEAA